MKKLSVVQAYSELTQKTCIFVFGNFKNKTLISQH